jgi:hypothetical protein
MRANTITLDKINELYYLDSEYILRHRKNRPGTTAHSPVGHISQFGYLSTEISRKSYRVHRIIYQLIHSLDILDPNLEVDHIDLNPLNNHPSNLRLCEPRENSRNRSRMKDSCSGFKGVSFDRKSNKWRARIRVDYELISLGSYSTKEDAYLTYQEASKKYHGEFGRLE